MADSNFFSNQSSNMRQLQAIRVGVDPKWGAKQTLGTIRLILVLALPFALSGGYIYLFYSSKIDVSPFIFSLMITAVILFFIIKYNDKKTLQQAVYFVEDGSVYVEYNAGPRILKKDNDAIELTKSKNGKAWIIGKGSNLI